MHVFLKFLKILMYSILGVGFVISFLIITKRIDFYHIILDVIIFLCALFVWMVIDRIKKEQRVLKMSDKEKEAYEQRVREKAQEKADFDYKLATANLIFSIIMLIIYLLFT